ncbi:hypothetical protein MNY66_11755 [Moellerella wisconsensis]|uniref:hypothetical protein n=1 Tax=Moellerella wisconsensis TaxID=158849 RepID=UPI001F4EE3C4|nr:hypothetical protein [Moellerella wisconsensis]UNH41713.1 hypothetical protein MNY66_11755 [Moellerella wisconsensis]
MKVFSFYLPSSIYGGTEILMIRLIEYLSNYHTIKIYTRKNSFVDKKYKVKNNNISIHYSLNNVDDNAYFIISSKYLIELAENTRGKKINLFIWQLQPIELISQFFPARKFNKKNFLLNKFIDLIYEKRRKHVNKLLTEYNNKNSLFFMDMDNYNTSNDYLNLNLDKANIIPVSIPFENHRIEKIKNDILTFCVVSRISYDFKFYSILHFIKALELYLKNNKMIANLIVVGDGEALDELKVYASNSIINFIFYGTIPIDKVYTDIYPKVDISFGMGTSLIDSSKYKIPTIVTNISNKKISEKEIKYSMFYESEGFSLGSYNNTGKKTLNHILDNIINNQSIHGEKCYLYAKENHSSEVIFDKINSIISIEKNAQDTNLICNSINHARYFDLIYKVILKKINKIFKYNSR